MLKSRIVDKTHEIPYEEFDGRLKEKNNERRRRRKQKVQELFPKPNH